MKKLIPLILLILIIPFKVSALESINVYLFKGDGCPHCAAAEEFFSSIENDYGQYFNLKEYEVWHSTDNYNLMQSVGSVFEEKPRGVPYIVICDKTYSGYSETYDDTLKEQILSCYKGKRYDVIEHLGEVNNEPKTDEVITDNSNKTEETNNNYNKIEETNKETDKNNDISKYIIVGGTCVAAVLIALLIDKKIAK